MGKGKFSWKDMHVFVYLNQYPFDLSLNDTFDLKFKERFIHFTSVLAFVAVKKEKNGVPNCWSFEKWTASWAGVCGFAWRCCEWSCSCGYHQWFLLCWCWKSGNWISLFLTIKCSHGSIIWCLVSFFLLCVFKLDKVYINPSLAVSLPREANILCPYPIFSHWINTNL